MRKICSILMFLVSTVTLAMQTKMVNDGETVHADISQSELTRIFVQSDRIKEIKSANNNFLLEKDEENGQIFFMPNAGQESIVNLFLTTEQGKTILLSLKPKLTAADTLKLELNPLKSEAAYQKHISYESNIFQLIKAMRLRHSLPGYITKPAEGKVVKNGLEKSEIMSYLGKFNGKILSVKNQTDTLIRIEEEEFKENGIKAIAIANRFLMPHQTTEAYLVFGASA